jgi:hypothetical protein
MVNCRKKRKWIINPNKKRLKNQFLRLPDSPFQIPFKKTTKEQNMTINQVAGYQSNSGKNVYNLEKLQLKIG